MTNYDSTTDCPAITLTDDLRATCERLAATDRPLAPFAAALLELAETAGDGR